MGQLIFDIIDQDLNPYGNKGDSLLHDTARKLVGLMIEHEIDAPPETFTAREESVILNLAREIT